MSDKNSHPQPTQETPLKATFHFVIPLLLTENTALAITNKFGQIKAGGLGMTH